MYSSSPHDQSHEPQKSQAERELAQPTQRDLDILRLIGEQTAYRFDQLQGLLARHPQTQAKDPAFLSQGQTSALIRRWKLLSLASSDNLRPHELRWISLTQRGLDLVGISAPLFDPSHADLDHLFWVNETRALVEENYGLRPRFRWESEREYRQIREHFKAQQKQELDVPIPLEYQSPHHPDAVLRYCLEEDTSAPEIVSAINIELSEQAYPTWKKIFADLTHFFDSAHYYVDPALKSSLEKALEKFQSEKPVFADPERGQWLSIHIHELEQKH